MGFERWSIQCKAFGSGSVTSHHVLRELGIAVLNGYDVLVFVTTGSFASSALDTIARIMERTHVFVLPIDGVQLQRLARDESVMQSLIRTHAAEARRFRLGASPAEILREIDRFRPQIAAGTLTELDVWARLQSRDVFVSREVFSALFAVWSDRTPE